MHKHEQWLKFAHDDLVIGKRALLEHEVIIWPALYHAQQCAEKALKAYLIFKKQQPRRTHDLVDLLELCMEFDPEFKNFLQDAADLTPYVSESRYPDDSFVMPDTSVAHYSLDRAAHILSFVRSKIL